MIDLNGRSHFFQHCKTDLAVAKVFFFRIFCILAKFCLSLFGSSGEEIGSER